MKGHFNVLLEQHEDNSSRDLEIEELKSKIKSFKKDNKVIYDKIEKLKAVGLTNTPSYTKTLLKLQEEESFLKSKIRDIESLVKAANDVKNYKAEYLLKYPSYTFISKKAMIDIMKKYNLVLGDAFLYSKEIPENSLNIISNFSEEIQKSNKTLYLCLKYSNRSYRYYYYFIDEKEYNKCAPEDIIVHRKFTISKFKMIAPKSHFEIPTIKIPTDIMMDDGETYPVFELNKDNIYVKSEFERLNKDIGKMQEVLDPIAVLEVPGGYIIMDAWDEEAKIPELNRQSLN